MASARRAPLTVRSAERLLGAGNGRRCGCCLREPGRAEEIERRSPKRPVAAIREADQRFALPFERLACRAAETIVKP